MRKGQVSAELILVVAAVLAIAFLFVSQLQSTAKDASKKLDDRANKILDVGDKKSTATKKESRRRVEPMGMRPQLPQSTWRHSPGQKWSERKALTGLGRTRWTYSRTTV